MNLWRDERDHSVDTTAGHSPPGHSGVLFVVSNSTPEQGADRPADDSDLSADETDPPADGTDRSVYSRLVTGTEHAIFVTDSDGVITFWSPPAEALYGHTSAEIRGEPLTALFADDSHDERGLDSLLSEATETAVETERRHRRADGSEFWASTTLSPLWNDHLHGYAVVSENTTAAHRREQRLERQNDRIKEFVDTLVHDLRNPLNVIVGRIELARETGDAEHFDAAEDSAARMSSLVDDLLEVVRHGELVTEPELTDLRTVVERAWEATGASSESATVHYGDLGAVAVDPDRTCEVFENLFRNAVEHGGEDVTVTVGELHDGFYVADDGPGIPAEQREAVFDHGVTTAEGGNGYGLSVVRTIANAHGWDVRVTASETGGARFEFSGVERRRVTAASPE